MNEDSLDSVTKIQNGEITLQTLIAASGRLAILAQQMMAVASLLNKGTLYKELLRSKETTENCTDLHSLAVLQMTLESIHESSESIKKSSGHALDGSQDTGFGDGHNARFAELIRLSGQTYVEFEDLGTFSIKGKPVVVPPSKKADEHLILKWYELCIANDFDERICTLDEAKAFAAQHKYQIPKYMIFHYWARDQKVVYEQFTWPQLQSYCKQLEQVPEFLTTRNREEVKRS